MSELKWTAGPWKEWNRANGDSILILDGRNGIAVASTCRQTLDGEEQANAHLLAAAPEVYEAAAEALKFIEANGLSHGRKLAAALAKARGETP